jgi:hypothetical protein
VQFQHHHLRLGLVPLPSKPSAVGNRNKPGVLFPRRTSSAAQCRNNSNGDCTDNKPSNFNVVLRHNKHSEELTIRPDSVPLVAEPPPVLMRHFVRRAPLQAVVFKEAMPVAVSKGFPVVRPHTKADKHTKAADTADHFALPASIGVNESWL